jgi:hypothetical protein
MSTDNEQRGQCSRGPMTGTPYIIVVPFGARFVGLTV